MMRKIIARKIKCTKCKIFKILSNFYTDKDKSSGYRKECKSCISIRPKNLNKELVRNRTIKWKYGITSEEYETLVFKQNNLCAICDKPNNEQRLDIDHNHETGKVRGLLCHQCNLAIGCFKDNIEFMKKAIKYLRKYE
jgi:hypothetical protein